MTFVLLLGLFIPGFCQQRSISGLSNWDKYAQNIAYPGMNRQFILSGFFREQWQSIPGHPSTKSLMTHFPWTLINGGAGFLIRHDQIGLESHFHIQSSANYIYNADRLIFSTGIYLSGEFLNLDLNKSKTPEGEYNGTQINHNDPLLSAGGASGFRINTGLGIYVRSPWLDGGFTIYNLLRSQSSDLYRDQRHLVMSLSREIKINRFKIIPQMVLMTDFFEYQNEIILDFYLNGNIFGGGMIRGYNGNSLESVGARFGFKLTRDIQLAYQYEFSIGQRKKNIFGPSQELGISYKISTKEGLSRSKIWYNPRWSD